MSPIAVLLALGSTIRPTSLAAVDALLVSARARRLLLAYVVAGVLVSVGIGVLLVSVLHHVVAASPRGHAGFELLFGLGAIFLARDPRGSVAQVSNDWIRLAQKVKARLAPGPSEPPPTAPQEASTSAAAVSLK